MQRCCELAAKLTFLIVHLLISSFFRRVSAPAPFDHYFSGVLLDDRYGEIYEEPIESFEHEIELDKSANARESSSSSVKTSTLSASISSSSVSSKATQLPLNELISSVLKIYPADVCEELDARVKESGANEVQLRAIFEPIINALAAKNIQPNDVKKLYAKNKKARFVIKHLFYFVSKKKFLNTIFQIYVYHKTLPS